MECRARYEVAQGPGADHAGLGEHVADPVVSGKRAGMRRGRLAPVDVRPAFSNTTGSSWDALAVSAKARLSFRTSQCCVMIAVFGSCSKKASRSTLSTRLAAEADDGEDADLAEREKR